MNILRKLLGRSGAEARHHNTAFDFRRDIFDWRKVPPVDPQEVENWRGRTDAVELQFPLQLALQVHDELELELMQPGKLDALRLSEIRGGIKALSRFAQTYNTALCGPKKPDEGTGEQ